MPECYHCGDPIQHKDHVVALDLAVYDRDEGFQPAEDDQRYVHVSCIGGAE